MSNYKSKHTGAQVDEAVSKVLNGEVGGGVTPNDSLFEKGDAENSAVLKGGNNQVISEGGVALGKDNLVGLKGWYINRFDRAPNGVPEQHAIVISSQNTELDPNYNYDENFENTYEAGDIISIQIGSIFTDIGTIVSTQGNYIEFIQTKYFSIPQSDPEKRYYCWVLSKPNAGVVDLGQNAISYGLNNQSLSECAYTEGKNNKSFGKYAHVEGKENEGHYCSHVEGSNNIASGNTSHAEGTDNRALNSNTHVEGRYTSARGYASHAEGYGESLESSTEASGEGSHAEGRTTKAQGNYSHTEGQYTSAVGIASHAEGKGESLTKPNKAEGNYSHVEGEKTKASGVASHSEGMLTKAIGKAAHSEGRETKTTNDYTHAEGYLSEAAGIGSHAEGVGTQTKNNGEHAEGRFNKSNSVAPNEGSNPKNTLHSVGIGTSDTARKNAHEIMQDGKHYILGVGNYDGTNLDGATDVATVINDLKSNGGGSSVIPDWNAQVRESGYIENKPFYISYSNKITEYQQNQLLNYKSKEIIFNDRLITLSIGENIIDSHLKLILSVDDDNDYWLMAEYYGEPYNVLTVYAGVYIKKLNEYYLPDIVIKTTPQTLSDTAKNQALANLGIDPVVWKYICNPIRLNNTEIPEELIGEKFYRDGVELYKFKYLIPSMYIIVDDIDTVVTSIETDYDYDNTKSIGFYNGDSNTVIYINPDTHKDIRYKY